MKHDILPSLRINWIDSMRGVFIFLVILYHSGAPWEYAKFLNPFVMGGFFFLSGYLFHSPGKTWDWRYKLIRIAESLLLPYFLYWTLTYFVKAAYYEVYLQGNWGIFVPYFRELLSGCKLWFMSAIIVGEVVLTGIVSVSRNTFYLAGMTVLFSFLWWLTPLSVPGVFWPWYLPSACIALCFMLLGVIVRANNLLACLERKGIVFLALLTYPLLYVLDLVFDLNQISFASNYYSNLLLFYLYALCGIAFIYVLCSKFLSGIRVLHYMGRSSLLMYFFCNQVILLIARLTGHGWGLSAYVWSVVAACAACLLLVIPVEVTKRWLPWMAGMCRVLSRVYRKS